MIKTIPQGSFERSSIIYRHKIVGPLYWKDTQACYSEYSINLYERIRRCLVHSIFLKQLHNPEVKIMFCSHEWVCLVSVYRVTKDMNSFCGIIRIIVREFWEPATAATPSGRGCAISVANLKQGRAPYHFSWRMSMYPLLAYLEITAEILSCKQY